MFLIKLQVDDFILDGNISVEEDSQSIKDRKNLSANGYMEVTILITPKGKIHKTPY